MGYGSVEDVLEHGKGNTMSKPKPLKLVDPLTPEMIKAGVDELRQFSFGRPEEQIVEAVYLAMEYARRASLENES